jgi:membrane-bound lytic murein transglycosylase A
MLPDKPSRPFRKLLIAQDTGGAIRGAVRGDVYWGTGAQAERLAGAMKSKGKLFVLLPKKVAAKLAPKKLFEVRAP